MAITKINKFPDGFEVKLFTVQLFLPTELIVLTNNLTQNSIDDVQNVYSVRWKIKEFHRELKQFTEIKKC